MFGDVGYRQMFRLACVYVCVCMSSPRQIDKLIQFERVFHKQMVLVVQALAFWD